MWTQSVPLGGHELYKRCQIKIIDCVILFLKVLGDCKASRALYFIAHLFIVFSH